LQPWDVGSLNVSNVRMYSTHCGFLAGFGFKLDNVEGVAENGEVSTREIRLFSSDISSYKKVISRIDSKACVIDSETQEVVFSFLRV